LLLLLSELICQLFSPFILLVLSFLAFGTAPNLVGAVVFVMVVMVLQF
jgi:hypothetical protein